MSFETGPYLATAVLCENVIEDKQGVLSLIKIVDRIVANAGPNTPERMPPMTVSLFAVIGIKSGQARGSHHLTLRQEAPSGIRKGELSVPVFLEGEDRGNNAILQLTIQTDEEGLHWFDVLFDNQLMTRIPLRLLYQRLSAQQGPLLGPSEK